MVHGICSDRKFIVLDASKTSETHGQHVGICQGCPLSSFLFVIIMTTLISYAKELLLHRQGGALDPSLVIHEMLHANDTLLLDASGGSVELYM
eukprot:4322755-Heterocapsa_arctica.AAC.1